MSQIGVLTSYFGLIEFNFTFIATIVNFLILFLFLKKFLFEKVTDFINAREEEVRNNIQDAENDRIKANALKADYEGKLKNAESEGRDIIRDHTVKAERNAQDIMTKADADAKHLIENAKREIEREKVKAINSLKDDISDLAILAAERVVEKDLDEKSHRELIHGFIEEVGDTKWQN